MPAVVLHWPRISHTDSKMSDTCMLLVHSRPKNMDEVESQEEVVAVLKNTLSGNDVSRGFGRHNPFLLDNDKKKRREGYVCVGSGCLINQCAVG